MTKEIINTVAEICLHLCGISLMSIGVYKILINDNVYDSVILMILGLSVINNARIVNINNKLEEK